MDSSTSRRRTIVALFLALLAGAAQAAVAPGNPPHPGPKLAKGRFLVATRGLRDPNFAESVVLLIDYASHGAMGVIVNRPTEVPLAMALPEVDELQGRKDALYAGGPVGRTKMVLLLRAATAPPESMLVFDDVYVSGSVEALRAGLRRAKNGDGLRAYAGYAGWGPGQLDAEVARGDWLVAPADAKTIFDSRPDEVWHRLIERVSGDWADHKKGPLTPALSPRVRCSSAGRGGRRGCGRQFSPFRGEPQAHDDSPGRRGG